MCSSNGLSSSAATVQAFEAQRRAAQAQTPSPTAPPCGTESAEAKPVDVAAACERNDATALQWTGFRGTAAPPDAALPTGCPAAAGDLYRSGAAPEQQAPAPPPTGLQKTLADNPHIKTNQQLINHYYKKGGGTWEGASRLAQADGKSMTQLVRDRQGPAAAPTSPPSAPPSAPPTARSAPTAPPVDARRAPTTAPTTTAPGSAGTLNERVADATRRYRGTDTSRGPDRGNKACAWAVNNILKNAGVKTLGRNPNWVPDVEADLKNGRGTRVSLSEARPGDIVIWPGQQHIGIMSDGGRVASNASSNATFTQMTRVPAGARIYRLQS